MDQDTVNLKHTASLECEDCEYIINTTESELFDDLPRLEVEISVEEKYKLIHISGNVVRNTIPDLNDTRIHADKYGL